MDCFRLSPPAYTFININNTFPKAEEKPPVI